MLGAAVSPCRYNTHPVDVLLEGGGDLGLLLGDHGVQGVQLLQPELQGPRPAAQEGLPGPQHRLPLHAADSLWNRRHAWDSRLLCVDSDPSKCPRVTPTICTALPVCKCAK